MNKEDIKKFDQRIQNIRNEHDDQINNKIKKSNEDFDNFLKQKAENDKLKIKQQDDEFKKQLEKEFGIKLESVNLIKLNIYEAYDNGEISYGEKEYLLEQVDYMYEADAYNKRIRNLKKQRDKQRHNNEDDSNTFRKLYKLNMQNKKNRGYHIVPDKTENYKTYDKEIGSKGIPTTDPYAYRYIDARRRESNAYKNSDKLAKKAMKESTFDLLLESINDLY